MDKRLTDKTCLKRIKMSIYLQSYKNTFLLQPTYHHVLGRKIEIVYILLLERVNESHSPGDVKGELEGLARVHDERDFAVKNVVQGTVRQKLADHHQIGRVATAPHNWEHVWVREDSTRWKKIMIYHIFSQTRGKWTWSANLIKKKICKGNLAPGPFASVPKVGNIWSENSNRMDASRCVSRNQE